MYTESNELAHYGVKGMKWGVRRGGKTSGGIAGMIRNKQRKNAERDLQNAKNKRKQVEAELTELKGYEKNPSKLGKSKISTAIRRSQIKSLTKTRDSLKKIERENVEALKELDSIEKYQAKKRASKAAQKLQKTKIKDLEKQYGELENQMTYGKNADAKRNTQIERQMAGIDRQLNQLKKKR